LLVICVKPFLIRVRPSKLEVLLADSEVSESMIGFHWSGDVSALTIDASHGFFHDALHSFPSGHTATACALAWCLSRMYPNGRFVFWSFATMVACQRLFAQAHYLSDTLAGALIGVLVAALIGCYWKPSVELPSD
jgi:membrane-associated phospholipid phosphatase